MISDDVIYAGLLVFSVLFGLVIRKYGDPKTKQVVSSGVGLLMAVLVCGRHVLHSVLTVAVNCVLLKVFSPRQCHIASFIWCFGYIMFFRTSHFFGLPKVPSHSNAVQLLLTLKLVGLAFEIHDSEKNQIAAEQPGASEEAKMKHRYQSVRPSVWDMICYSYCYVGLLTGPYYKFRTWYDMLHHKNIQNIPLEGPVLSRMKWVPVVAAGFLLASSYFNIKYAETDEFYELPFAYRLLFMVPMFFIFRTRFYFAWLLSECMCMTVPLGAYPASSKPRCGVGPTDFQALQKCDEQDPDSIEYDFETVHNIDMWGCEFAPTVREGMRSWNMTVQSWLSSNVYKRVPQHLKPWGVTITMTVSAYWHGIYPGYYLCFLTVPPIVLAEDVMTKAFRTDTPPTQQKVFDWICWFFKMRYFDYMNMGFMLLSLYGTLRYWSSIYFLGHLVTVIFLAVGYIFRPHRSKHDKKDGRVEKKLD